MAEYLPTIKTNFKVEINGIDFGNFISVAGLGVTAEICDDIGGMDRLPRKIPGKVKYGEVTLVRNCDPKDKALRAWWETVEKNEKDPEVKDVSVVFFDRGGVNEITRRNLYACIPSGWEISDLSSTDNNPITETIKFHYEDADWA